MWNQMKQEKENARIVRVTDRFGNTIAQLQECLDPMCYNSHEIVTYFGKHLLSATIMTRWLPATDH